MKANGYIKLAVAILMLPILASCRHELCYEHFPVLDMSFLWEQEWERDYGRHHLDGWDSEYHGREYGELRPDVPEWITMVKYHEEGEPEERYLTPDGARYIMDDRQPKSILLYNGDTEYIVLSDVASMFDARATATSRSRASISFVTERHPDARSTNPPDVLYAAFYDNMTKINNHETRQMPVKMQPLVYTYVITYEFEHGIENVALARGALGGMAESVYLRNGTTSDNASIILFDCDIKSYGCRAEVRSFGVPGFPDSYYGRNAVDDKKKEYTLNLEVRLFNGKTLEYNFDISDQLADQPRGGIIKVSGIRIEDEVAQGGGSAFDVDVSDWGSSVDIDLPVSAD